MQLSRYLKIYPCTEQPGRILLYSTKRSALIQIPEATLRAARDGTLAGADRDTLVRLGFLVPDPAAERLEMRDIFVNANRQRRQFNAMVVLNLDCNLACGYCYEDNFRGSFYMSADTADLLVESVIGGQIAKGNAVKLSFYGGEPLLSAELIKEIASRLQAAAQRAATKFMFSLVTNGTLLSRSLVQELIPLGLAGAKVTLDGPGETHDVSRPFVSGSGSFDVILDNVAQICDLIQLNLGGNFTRENYSSFPALLDRLAERGVTPDRVARIQFAPVVKKSGEKAAGDFGNNCVCSYEPWLMEAGLYLREETLKRGYPTPKVKMSACTVEYESDLVINYDGSLYKCPAFMSHDSLRIGTLKEGVSDYRVSHNMDVWKKDDCLDCAYLPICFGGCRQMTLLRTDAIEEVDCRKEFYDASLEKSLRQDLRYPSAKKR
ncbi:MAG: putative geopeptide radical SAM maturase [Geobacteraceae bacterium GWC2_58_44]|nr:MAG: putative geopeptide radical SAM maturase [Geobacteraceae bacterium GWC2_58_44]HBG04253.1 putative geopeptide radical SAM maturase [Geobacter sp.]